MKVATTGTVGTTITLKGGQISTATTTLLRILKPLFEKGAFNGELGGMAGLTAKISRLKAIKKSTETIEVGEKGRDIKATSVRPESKLHVEIAYRVSDTVVESWTADVPVSNRGVVQCDKQLRHLIERMPHFALMLNSL